jgi:hypothetical protein
MATINEKRQAIQQLNVLSRRKDDAEDDGFLADVGAEWLRVSAAMAERVRKTGKSCKGQLVVTIDLLGYKSKNGEVKIDPKVQAIKTKQPPTTIERNIELYAGHEGELSTVPVQEEMGPLFDPKVVEGGKVEPIGKGKKVAT